MSDDFGSRVSEAEEISMDELQDAYVEEQAFKDAERSILLPKGTYTTVPGEFKGKASKKDGRVSVQFWGTVQLGDVKAKQGYWLSHELRNKFETVTDEETGAKKERDTGKADFKSKLFIMAQKAYTTAFGEPPLDDKGNISAGKIYKYLETYAHRIHIVQTEKGDNMVVSISAVNEQ